MDEATEWTARRTEDGSWTLVSPVHGEACHSASGAWAEARVRYARACRIRERARLGTPVRLLDVGTGAAWNLVAALAEAGAGRAPLFVTTLERDPRVFLAAARTAQPSAEDPEPLARAKEVQRAILALLRRARECTGRWVRLPEPFQGRLRLYLGDARATLREVEPGPRFDAVFLDPFSPRRAPDLWGEDFLRDVARRMAPGSILSTYSAAFSVRLGLARAGLRVGRGASFGRKREGTLASPDLDLTPLGEGVRERLRASLSAALGRESAFPVRNRPGPCAKCFY